MQWQPQLASAMLQEKDPTILEDHYCTNHLCGDLHSLLRLFALKTQLRTTSSIQLGLVSIGGISRMSAFSMYPMIVLVCVTKMKAIQNFLTKTPLSMYLGVIKEAHNFHVHIGACIAFDVCKFFVVLFAYIAAYPSEIRQVLISYYRHLCSLS